MYQRICTECGTPFTAAHPKAKTCSTAHRQARYQRRKGDPDAPEFAIELGPVQAAMQTAQDLALEDLPNVAREVLADELRPAVREMLEGEVLDSIGAMIELMPLAQRALADELMAAKFEFNDDGTPLLTEDGRRAVVADHEARHRAAALIFKYTVGQPGLAPQPEAPSAAPIQIVFPEGLGGTVHVDATAEEEVPELLAGEKLCDLCHQPKPEDEFVAGSDRCYRCHHNQTERVKALIAERTGERKLDAGDEATDG